MITLICSDCFGQGIIYVQDPYGNRHQVTFTCPKCGGIGVIKV